MSEQLQVIKKWWGQLQPRERSVLLLGSIVVPLILAYLFIFEPWQAAMQHMSRVVPIKRSELAWMREQAEVMRPVNGSSKPRTNFIGKNQSLMSVLQKTANQQGLQKSIKQITPRPENDSVSVLMEDVSFNGWVRWITGLEKKYGVNVVQLSAERDDDKPDIAEIRVRFERK